MTMRRIFAALAAPALAITMALAAVSPASAERPRELAWEDLIPGGLTVFEQAVNLAQDAMGGQSAGRLTGVIPHGTYIEVNYEAGQQRVEDLNGERVSILGYATPVGDWSLEGQRQFVLVPFIGCFHIPNPPANQIIYFEFDDPVPFEYQYEPFRVTGVINTTDPADDMSQYVGYVIDVEDFERIDEGW